ncbi:MAG: hypothetical protein WAU88_14595, partial [Candidatus Zixiibacteriota bacterium]
AVRFAVQVKQPFEDFKKEVLERDLQIVVFLTTIGAEIDVRAKGSLAVGAIRWSGMRHLHYISSGYIDRGLSQLADGLWDARNGGNIFGKSICGNEYLWIRRGVEILLT